MKNLYVIGNVETVMKLKAEVDIALGYPKYGVRADTGEPILPSPGQDPATVPGVTLSWTDATLNVADPSLAAYPYDEVTSQVIDAIVAGGGYEGLQGGVTLDATWFPQQNPIGDVS